MRTSILITGATSGIGHAATIEFASRGYDVFATYRSDHHRAELAALDNVHPVQMDVTSAEDTDRAFAALAEELGEAGLPPVAPHGSGSVTDSVAGAVEGKPNSKVTGRTTRRSRITDAQPGLQER